MEDTEGRDGDETGVTRGRCVSVYVSQVRVKGEL